MPKPRRTPLTRERVLRAAVALADESGIESLSMRRLGQELGVEAMSLYNHVANKDDLLNGITDLVLREIDLPEAGDWKEALRRHAISAHDVLVSHPWACSLALSPDRNSTASVRARGVDAAAAPRGRFLARGDLSRVSRARRATSSASRSGSSATGSSMPST